MDKVDQITFVSDLPYNPANEELTYFLNHTLAENDNEALLFLTKLHYADIADLIDLASNEQRFKIIELLQDKFDSRILVELDPSVRSQIIDRLGSRVIHDAIGNLDAENILDIIEDLPHEQQNQLIASLPEYKQTEVRATLTYPENSAGRVMRKQLIATPQNWSVKQAKDYVSDCRDLPEEFYDIIIIDDNNHVLGTVPLSRLMRAKDDVLVQDIMEKDVKYIHTHIDQEEVSFIFRQYGIISAPVVDDNSKLVGVIFIGDVVEIVEEEAEEDIMRMAGVHESDLHAASLQTARYRFPWLFINLIAACITSSVIDLFSDTIHQLVILAAIMPIVASMAGNAGTQTLTIAVRAIAHKELSMLNARRIITKEMVASFFNGLLLAVLGGVILNLWHNEPNISLVFMFAVMINFTIAGFLGSFIPIFLNRINIDPAIASSVFLTTLTDIISFFSFLGAASYFLL